MMQKRSGSRTRSGALALCFLSAVSVAAADAQEGIAFFERHIRPLLAEHCYKCHSSQADEVKGGLLLDSRSGWERGGDSGEAVTPGQPEESLLLRAVRYGDPDLQMPPKYRLPEAATGRLEEWIAMGAPGPAESEVGASGTLAPEAGWKAAREFWSFVPPRRSAPPVVRDVAWGRDPVDAYILAGLEKRGLKPVGDARRVKLIRRITFDLTGLPPSPDEIRRFVEDPRHDDEALASVVDRLMASPQFGERWGRHWLDVVRFAESMGRTRNIPFPEAWRYRDYVMNAFNQDKPFDRFLTEQIAGDLLPAASVEERREALIATGLLALGSLDLNEANVKLFLMDRVDEQIDTVTRSFMALTVSCARCHDHKFDPVPTRDYYALAGIFQSTDLLGGYRSRRGGAGREYFDPAMLISLPGGEPPPHGAGEMVQELDERQKQIAQRQQRLRTRQQQLNRRIQAGLAEEASNAAAGAGRRNGRGGGAGSGTPAELRAELRDVRQKLRALDGERSENFARRVQLAGDSAMGVRESAEIGNSRVHIRGEVNNLGEEVPRGFLSFVGPEEAPSIPPEMSGRLELAQWLTEPGHPLTARVMANRVWQHLFGDGLVETADNLGETGARPTHPDLLDHLAMRFVEGGWSVKSLVRALVLSRTYRLDSAHDPGAFAVDPSSELRWRMSPRRLEAEAIRDAMFMAGGELDLGRPEGSAVSRIGPGEINRTMGAVEEEFNRPVRSVYLPILRDHLPHMLEIFDFAHPSQVTGRRDVTTVSTQALYFMNNPFVANRAHAVCEATSGWEEEPAARITEVYLRVLGREPDGAETERALEFVRGAEEGEGAGVEDAWASFVQALFASAEFRYVQ